MISTGWKPNGPNVNQALAPFTVRPATSTAIIDRKATPSSAGTNRRHAWYGTRRVTSSATPPSTIHSACLRK